MSLPPFHAALERSLNIISRDVTELTGAVNGGFEYYFCGVVKRFMYFSQKARG